MRARDWRVALVDRLRERINEQRRVEAHRFLEDDLRALWREACAGVGLCQYIHVAAGITVRTPKFGGLRSGAGLTFSTELLPGQEPEDLRAHAARLAHTLGAHGLRVEPLAGRWVRIVLLHADPLTARVPLPDSRWPTEPGGWCSGAQRTAQRSPTGSPTPPTSRCRARTGPASPCSPTGCSPSSAPPPTS